MADAVALASIATTGAVAIAVPVIAGWTEERRARRRLAAARFDELRAVLDEAALALDSVSLELGGTSSLIELDEPTLPTSRQKLKQLKKLELALRSVNVQKRRVALRLGEPSPLYRALDEADDVGWAAWDVLMGVIFHEQEWDASRSHAVEESASRLRVLVSEFTALASARIGPTATY